MPLKAEKIALYGGSFDPPHLGHFQLLQSLSDHFDKILIVPVFNHPYSKDLSPYSFRVQCLELMLKKLSSKYEISKIEEKLALGKSYMIANIKALIKENPKASYSLVLGTDCLQDFENWKDVDEIKKLVQIYPIKRAGFEESLLMKVSSSEIREKIKNKKDVSMFLLPEINKLIKDLKVYQ